MRDLSHSLIVELREALGLFSGAMTCSPKEAWDEAITMVKALSAPAQDAQADERAARTQPATPAPVDAVATVPVPRNVLQQAYHAILWHLEPTSPEWAEKARADIEPYCGFANAATPAAHPVATVKDSLGVAANPVAGQDERAWLVEWKGHGYGPQWWGFPHTPGKNASWCEDANSAIRFARREDAERMRLHIIAVAGLTGLHGYERSITATEHEWPAVQPTYFIDRPTVNAAPTAPQAPALVPLTEHHKLDNDQQVFFYEQDFYVLSNFSSFALHWKGLDFPTSEHAYHYEKFVGNDDAWNSRGSIAEQVHRAPSAHEAFKLAEASKCRRRQDWDNVKVGIMRDILREKVRQHEYVRHKLLATGDRELIEDSWRDDYWGWGPNRDGQNMLGKLWMEVRAELRAGIGTTATKEQSNG